MMIDNFESHFIQMIVENYDVFATLQAELDDKESFIYKPKLQLSSVSDFAMKTPIGYPYVFGKQSVIYDVAQQLKQVIATSTNQEHVAWSQKLHGMLLNGTIDIGKYFDQNAKQLVESVNKKIDVLEEIAKNFIANRSVKLLKESGAFFKVFFNESV